MPQRGRNELCWCGSGEKYKKCHGRAGRDKGPYPFSEILSSVSKVRRRRKCFHFDAPTDCSPTIIAAHTVQKSILRSIAENGNVYHLSMDFASGLDQWGQMNPTIKKIESASTIFAFCEHHDQVIFRPIEAAPITACDEHAAILTYRAHCYELWAKESMVQLGSDRRQWDAGRSARSQIEYQKQVSVMNNGATIGLRDLRDRNLSLTSIIQSKSFHRVRYCVFWFETPPDVMCAGGKNPEYDFHGKLVQDLSNEAAIAQAIYITLGASGGRGFAFFSWIDTDDSACVPYMRSLQAHSHEDLPHAIIRLVFGHIENLYWRPSWWASLFKITRDALMNRFTIAGDLTRPTPSDFLCDDGIRAIKWRIIGIDSSIQ